MRSITAKSIVNHRILIQRNVKDNMNTFVHNYPKYLVVDIHKPLYTHDGVDTVRVRDTYVKQASLTMKRLVVRTPNGEQVFFPKAVKKEAKKVKEVFLRPDDPMVMYELPVPHSPISDNDRWQWS